MAMKLCLSIFALVIAALIFIVVTYPSFRLIISDPAMRKAWQTCHSMAAENRAPCYQKLAIEQSNPDICWLIGPSIDDACMQSVFEASGDSSICSRISKPGVKALCEEHFRKAFDVAK